jgi:hypothetical protein
MSIKKYIAPFEVIRYVRADGNEAVYKVFRPTKTKLFNMKEVGAVGYKAWKLGNSGTNEGSGWRSFRFDRTLSRQYTFI